MALSLAHSDAVPRGWRTRQPGFGIWLVIAIVRTLLEMLFYIIYYVPRSLRQSPTWTYRQAFMTRLFERAFRVITEVGFTQSLSSAPGDLGDRWVTIDPAPDAAAYAGDFASDSVRPETVGGTWYPQKLLPDNDDEDGLVVLSFHGGSLLWMTGRPDDSGPAATLLNEALGGAVAARSFWLQYRLAGGNNPTPYPGAMQDAVTAYFYLTRRLGVSPSRIVLAGDSTGSTIAMALVRYLESAKNQPGHPFVGLPPPKACLLFSPSVEYSFEGDPVAVSAHRNIKTDYVESRMMAWGAAAIAPPPAVRLDDPYISPALHPFATPVPIFAQAGGAEVLCDSVRGFADAMAAVPGNRVEYLEVAGVPHDVYMAGALLGWPDEQKQVHEAAARFVHSCK